MKQRFLISNKYKKLGWILLVPSFLAGLYVISADFDPDFLKMKVISLFSDQTFGQKRFIEIIEVNIINTIVGVMFIAGAMMVAFSREKIEDEFIANTRMSSMMWAILVNYSLLLIAFIFIYGVPFLNVMIYNMFTVLILFILRFNYMLYKNSKVAANEK